LKKDFKNSLKLKKQRRRNKDWRHMVWIFFPMWFKSAPLLGTDINQIGLKKISKILENLKSQKVAETQI